MQILYAGFARQSTFLQTVYSVTCYWRQCRETTKCAVYQMDITQRKTPVTDYLKSKQLLLFVFVL